MSTLRGIQLKLGQTERQLVWYQRQLTDRIASGRPYAREQENVDRVQRLIERLRNVLNGGLDPTYSPRVGSTPDTVGQLVPLVGSGPPASSSPNLVLIAALAAAALFLGRRS